MRTSKYFLFFVGVSFVLFILSNCVQKEKIITETVPPLVQPPLPELNPEFHTFSFNAEEGIIFSLPSGTEVSIPPASLKNAEDKYVFGTAIARFREFHNVIDIYLSGIPMDYNSGNFTTAGSFDLQVEQNGSPLFLPDSVNAIVKMASFETEDDYAFYFLDEEKRGWDSLGITKPEINLEKQAMNRKIRRMQAKALLPMGKKYMAFNYAAILDVYYNDDWSQINEEELLPKLKAYSLGWTKAEVYQRINFKGVEEHASLMLWKNRSGKTFPDWAKGVYAKLDSLGKNRYQCNLMKPDSTEQFSATLEAIMPLRMLFAYSPEKWKNQYNALMAKVDEEQSRLKMMADVYRTFEVNNFGIYNWDKLINNVEQVRLMADFQFESAKNETWADLDMIFITGDQKGMIKYPESIWKDMVMIPDEKGFLFSLLPGKKLAIYPTKSYGKITFDELRNRNEELPEFTFKMKESEKSIQTKEDLLKILELMPG